VDGCLRLLMIMGSIVLAIDAIMVICFMPETIRPEHKTDLSLWQFLRSSWRDLGQPWNNLRVLATPKLRKLMGIRELGYIIAAGGTSSFFSFYQRYEFDTLTMLAISSTSMFVGWLTLAAVPHVVSRYGDLCGIWLTGSGTGALFAAAMALLHGSVGYYATFLVFPLLGGPSFALNGIAPEVLVKLIPSGLQGTFQTGKSFIFRLTMATAMWPWMGLQVLSKDLPYPFDAIPLILTAALGAVACWLTMRQTKDDPHEAIQNGDALKEFWESDYARGPWYKLHAGDPDDHHGVDELNARCATPGTQSHGARAPAPEEVLSNPSNREMSFDEDPGAPRERPATAAV